MHSESKALRKMRLDLGRMFEKLLEMRNYDAAVAVCNAAKVVHEQYEKEVGKRKETKREILADLGSGI